MSDETIAPAPTDLKHARLGLLSAVAALVRYSRSLDEGLARDTVRHAIREMSNALVRIFPTDTVQRAQGHAIGTLELLGPADRLTADGLVQISGETVEMYAAELVKWFVAHDEERPGS